MSMRDPSQEGSWSRRALIGLVVAIGRLPGWARPAAIGAVLLACMTCFRGVFLLPLHHDFKSLLAFLLALVVASAGGALAGLAFTIVRIPMKALGTVGELLTGIVLTCVYVFGILIPAKYWFGDDTLSTRSGWIVALVVAVFFGVVATMAYWANARKYGR